MFKSLNLLVGPSLPKYTKQTFFLSYFFNSWHESIYSVTSTWQYRNGWNNLWETSNIVFDGDYLPLQLPSVWVQRRMMKHVSTKVIPNRKIMLLFPLFVLIKSFVSFFFQCYSNCVLVLFFLSLNILTFSLKILCYVSPNLWKRL